jgi:hypothetical protein
MRNLINFVVASITLLTVDNAVMCIGIVAIVLINIKSIVR